MPELAVERATQPAFRHAEGTRMHADNALSDPGGGVQVGMRVEARYQGGEVFYPGKVGRMGGGRPEQGLMC